VRRLRTRFLRPPEPGNRSIGDRVQAYYLRKPWFAALQEDNAFFIEGDGTVLLGRGGHTVLGIATSSHGALWAVVEAVFRQSVAGVVRSVMVAQRGSGED
jgi:hypothetical protein